MHASPAAAPENKPYKGPNSYKVEDADLFFGRDREAEQLVAKILSSRFTLVHAQSGAGKTSLLNARIIPELEARGWSAFRVIPQNDPVQSLRVTTLRNVLPALEAEAKAIARARSALVGAHEDVSLGELLKRYDRLDVRDPLRRDLIGPVPVPADDPAAEQKVETDVVPLFCRVLHSNMELETFSEHLAAVLEEGDPSASRPPVGYGTTVGELESFVSDPRMSAGYARLLNELNVPVSDLRVFFENLFEVYGGRRTRFAVVLILDQFEEMFTRFVDPKLYSADNRQKLPDLRLRDEFFDQFARLYGRAEPAPPEAGGGPEDGLLQTAATRLPVRYVISMREEYIAQLERIRQVIGTLDDVSFHLNLLEQTQAEEAIREPAGRFGYGYAEDCYKEIISQLTKEGRYVEPSHLQLICDRLWNEQGAALARKSLDSGEPAEGQEIPLTTFESLGGAKGILESFFEEFLDELSERDRREVLDLLEPLVTSSQTRNIVEHSQLVNAPFRNAALRAELLRKMTDRTIVRTEPRLGGYFVEITHEFLIEPIMKAVRSAVEHDPEYIRFRWALRALERLYGAGGVGRFLTAQEFQTLHANWGEVCWNRWGIEQMVRSAITYAADRAALRTCLDAYNNFERTLDVRALLEDKLVRHEGRDLLDLSDLCFINDRRDDLTLTRRETEYILHSTLATADDDERERIVYWTKRTLEDAA